MIKYTWWFIVKVKQTKSEQETINLGHQFGHLLRPGMVVLLNGGLASGKTTFTKGIGKALEIEKTINSPSYTIMKSYKTTEHQLYHFDLYRMTEEGMDFDFEDYINSNAVTVIEWPFNVKSLLPKEYILVNIEIIADNLRKFTFSAIGNKYEKVVNYIWFNYF